LDESLPLVLSQLSILYCLILLYNIFISLYTLLIRIVSTWNIKAKQWITGRKKSLLELQEHSFVKERIVWVHASSAGEFEQAKPIIEELKKNYPSYKIVVSFFSPSGYNAAKNYEAADYLFYLPVDTKKNAKQFIDTINPRLAIFVKYDFWYHYLSIIHDNQIPLLLVSSVFRKDQAFFKWYGKLYRKMLHFFTQIFVQNQPSLDLLQQYSINQTQVSGDTRFDRVATIAANFTEIPFINQFIANSKVLIAGSTWTDDEKILKDAIALIPELKLILAPHEINDVHIKEIENQFSNTILYSQVKDTPDVSKFNVLIIDNVGILSRLYKYATITYVGGGFTRDGIHNILEAAVYGKPVLFGPNHKKYREAKELIDYGGGFSIARSGELKSKTGNLLSDDILYKKTSVASLQYINSKKGATEKIINYIQEKRLLTN
jgi:3-deoxy-D-manno-octulosonic-acid transferase